MNENARAAFIMAQAALLNARIEGLKATNEYRARRGESQAYDESAFTEIEREFSCLEYNNCLSFLRGD